MSPKSQSENPPAKNEQNWLPANILPPPAAGRAAIDPNPPKRPNPSPEYTNNLLSIQWALFVKPVSHPANQRCPLPYSTQFDTFDTLSASAARSSDPAVPVSWGADATPPKP